MKRLVIALIATILALSMLLSVAALSSPSLLLGDLDRDEQLRSTDIRLMLRYLVGYGSLTADERLIADCDGNNRVDTLDVRYVLQVMTMDRTPSTVTVTTTTVATTTTTKPSLDDDGYYDEVVKP
ncbi:MAG: hypothetical protein E7553_02900 [Ruminococcaceae bacterium]|nr:hypothetical protein [Oscillospiraceae bacterium]